MTAAPGSFPPLVRPVGSRRLTVRAYPAIDCAGGLLLLIDETATAPEPPAGDQWHLSPREGEVMYWRAAGKTDREIGAILSISPCAVLKHLQRIYIKLGVETRMAAVLRWLAPR
jgi:DNA-binding CsgD family transcriptional regulator